MDWSRVWHPPTHDATRPTIRLLSYNLSPRYVPPALPTVLLTSQSGSAFDFLHSVRRSLPGDLARRRAPRDQTGRKRVCGVRRPTGADGLVRRPLKAWLYDRVV